MVHRNRVVKKTIFFYAFALAGIAWLLNFFQYKQSVRVLSTEGYVVLVALVFATLGLWMGRRLAGRRERGSFQRNQQALEYLGITERELEVLELVAKGMSNQQVADRLFVSTNTVKTHLKHLFDKLDVSRRTQAVGKARELRLIR